MNFKKSVAISPLLIVFLIKEGDIKVHGILLTDVSVVLIAKPSLVHTLLLAKKNDMLCQTNETYHFDLCFK